MVDHRAQIEAKVEAWRKANDGRLLTQEQVDALPTGTLVEIVWSGGNGPARYPIDVDGHGRRYAGNDYPHARWHNRIHFVGAERFHTQVAAAPKRIRLSRAKGYRKPEGAIVVARPSRWGNPFKVGGFYRMAGNSAGVWPEPVEKPWSEDPVHGGVPINLVEVAVHLYRMRLTREAVRTGGDYYDDELPPIRKVWPPLLKSLAGHDLACWCPLDQPCHADVLLEMANPGWQP